MKRTLVTEGDPDERVVIPAAADFAGEDWMDAAQVELIADALIERWPCFQDHPARLATARIVYLFKRKGATQPRLLLGKCQRPSGLLARFSGADFIIWLAANNCRGLTAWQFEALIYHELKHASMETGEPVIVPHDFEGFASEIEEYGLWKPDVKMIAEAVKVSHQRSLFGAADEKVDVA